MPAELPCDPLNLQTLDGCALYAAKSDLDGTPGIPVQFLLEHTLREHQARFGAPSSRFCEALDVVYPTLKKFDSIPLGKAIADCVEFASRHPASNSAVPPRQ